MINKFETLLQEFNQTISYTDFFINLIVTALLTFLLGLFYQKFGRSISNRKDFAHNFMTLGLTTMLIIMIVKSSIALSLGLVGALSIVRFRSAIKEPEELTYLFLTIAIGLAAGANQALLGAVAFIFILGILWIRALMLRKNSPYNQSGMYLSIDSKNLTIKEITKILIDNFETVDLKRLETEVENKSSTFLIQANDLSQMEKVQTELSNLDQQIKISFVEKKNLIN